MSSMQWGPIELAIHNWIKAGTGLDDAHIIWGAQGGPSPSVPFVSVRIIAVKTIGYDWVDVENNPTPSAGQEILSKVRGQRRLLIEMRCDGATAVGPTSPHALLMDVVAACSLPTISDAIAEVLGLADIGDVLASDPVVDSTLLEPIALLSVTGFAPAELVEAGTYIEFAQVTGTVKSPAGTNLADQTFQVGT